MRDLVSWGSNSHPQKTQTHKETSANGLSEGGSKDRGVREGEGRRMGREKGMRVRPVPLPHHGFSLPKLTLFSAHEEKLLSTPSST